MVAEYRKHMFTERCSFCGAHADTIEFDKSETYVVRWQVCRASTKHCRTVELAVELWNNRADGVR